MASLLDIGPLTREVDVGGHAITVHGVTPEGFFVLLDKFPALQELMGGGAQGLSMEILREVAPASISWVIALATTDRSRFDTAAAWLAEIKGTANVAMNLSVHHQIALFQAALQLTFPDGFAPFVRAMEDLADSINRVSGSPGKAPDTTSSKRSRTGFTTDSRGLRLGPGRPSANSRH